MNTERLELLQMTVGYWVSKMIYCAAELKIADLLAAGPKPVADLANKAGAHEESLHRLLRALASLGIFRETTPKTFALTSKAELLRSDHPEGIRDFAVMANGILFEGWCDILHSVRTGEGAVQKRFGGGFFDVAVKDPETAATFDRAMEQVHGAEVQLMLQACDWTKFRHIVDIGGGSGHSLLEILRACPEARGTVFDLPGVVERAGSSQHAAAARCSFVGGSFFDAIPAGGDCYTMRHVLHDWNDVDSVRILQTCRKAMPAGTPLLVVEKAILPGNEPEFAKLLDMNMLAIGGKERTLEQYEQLFAASGFRLRQLHRTPGPIDVIEAV